MSDLTRLRIVVIFGFLAFLIIGCQHLQLNETVRSKVSAELLNDIKRDGYQVVFVEFDTPEIRTQAKRMRIQKGLRFDDQEIRQFKKASYSEIRAPILNSARAKNIVVIKEYKHFPKALVRIKGMAQLHFLVAHPKVKRVYKDRLAYPLFGLAMTLIGQDATMAHGMIGSGTAVAVVDSGIDISESIFGGCTAPGTPACCKVVANENLFPADVCEGPSHGTAVSREVATVAPGADIVMVNIDSGAFYGGCFASSAIVAGMDWVLDNVDQHNFVAVNLSIGDGLSYTQNNCPSYLDAEYQALRDSGVIPVVAAGNDGYDNGINGYACSPLAVAVSSVYPDSDTINDSHNYGPGLDLLAPGASGTSLAAPIVAGAWAVMRAERPDLSLDEILDIFIATGKPVEGPLSGQIFPRIQLDAALDVGPVIPDDFKADEKFGFALTACDFNGDRADDLAIGVPDQNIPRGENQLSKGGVVNIIYGSPTGLSYAGGHLYSGESTQNQMLHLDSPDSPDHARAGDRFGSALACGNFNGDDYDDLVVSAPYKSVGGWDEAGVVYVFYGSIDGLTTNGSIRWGQDMFGAWEQAEAGDHFGRSLVSGDFNGDGKDDLAIGVPDESYVSSETGSETDAAGLIHVLYGTPDGLNTVGLGRSDQPIWHQDSPRGIRSHSGDFEHFGDSLASGDFNGDGRDDLAVGVPGQKVSGQYLAGAVNILYGSANGLTETNNQFWHQNKPNIQGATGFADGFGKSLAAGDFNADGKDDLAIGVPGEEVRGHRNAGAVNVLYGTANGLHDFGNQIWHQDLGARGQEYYGDTLVAGNFNADMRDDLSIGVPGDSSIQSQSGAVDVLYGNGTWLSAANRQFLYQDDCCRILGYHSEASDRFGFSLASGDFNNDLIDDLAVGVPFEDLPTSIEGIRSGCAAPTLQNDAGVVHIIYGTSQEGLFAKVEECACMPDPCPPELCYNPSGARYAQTWHQGFVTKDVLEDSPDSEARDNLPWLVPILQYILNDL